MDIARGLKQITGTLYRKYHNLIEYDSVSSAVGLAIAECIAKLETEDPRPWHQAAQWRVIEEIRREKRQTQKLLFLEDALYYDDQGKAFTYNDILVATKQNWKEPPNRGPVKDSGYQPVKSVFGRMNEMNNLGG